MPSSKFIFRDFCSFLILPYRNKQKFVRTLYFKPLRTRTRARTQIEFILYYPNFKPIIF